LFSNLISGWQFSRCTIFIAEYGGTYCRLFVLYYIKVLEAYYEKMQRGNFWICKMQLAFTLLMLPWCSFFSWSTLYIQNAHQVLLVWAKQLEGRNHQVIKKTQNVLTCVFWFIIIVWPVFWNVDVQSKYSKALEKTKMLLFITNSIL